MAFDYTQLQADILSWSVRSELAGQVPTFIRLAEVELRRLLRLLNQETDLTITTGSDGNFALPSDFLAFKHIVVAAASNPNTEYMPPTEFATYKQSPNNGFTANSINSGPLFYTIESSKLKTVAPNIVLDASYIRSVQPLSGSVLTNEILNDSYDVYLWGGLRELWDFVDEPEEVAKYSARFDRAVQQIVDQEISKRQPSGPMKRRTSAASNTTGRI